MFFHILHLCFLFFVKQKCDYSSTYHNVKKQNDTFIISNTSIHPLHRFRCTEKRDGTTSAISFPPIFVSLFCSILFRFLTFSFCLGLVFSVVFQPFLSFFCNLFLGVQTIFCSFCVCMFLIVVFLIVFLHFLRFLCVVFNLF